MADGEGARRVARQHNAVLVEVSQQEGDLKPRVDVHDYEFRDGDDNPAPARWVDVPDSWSLQHGWVPGEPPVVRVGKDAPRESANL